MHFVRDLKDNKSHNGEALQEVFHGFPAVRTRKDLQFTIPAIHASESKRQKDDLPIHFSLRDIQASYLSFRDCTCQFT